MCEWSNNDRNYVVNELLRFALSQDDEFQVYKESAASSGGGTRGSTGGISTQFVRLLDLSDPANPRKLQTFDEVSSIPLDDGRKLIYITNGGGLWILSHNLPPPHRLCDSEITDDANCYAY